MQEFTILKGPLKVAEVKKKGFITFVTERMGSLEKKQLAVNSKIP